MIDREQAGKLVKLAREKKGMTQEQLGLMIHCTKQQISNLERGKNNFTDEMKELLKKELEIDLFEFFSKGEVERLSVREENGMINKQLYDYKNMQDLRDSVNYILKEVECDPAFEKTVKKLLELTLYATIGYETYIMEPRRRSEEGYALEWGYIAWSIDNLINDSEKWPISDNSDWKHDNKSMLSRKLLYMADEIGAKYFEDFDEGGLKNGYAQQIGRSAEKSVYNIDNIIAGADNALITSYRAGILQLAERIESIENGLN